MLQDPSLESQEFLPLAAHCRGGVRVFFESLGHRHAHLLEFFANRLLQEPLFLLPGRGELVVFGIKFLSFSVSEFGLLSFLSLDFFEDFLEGDQGLSVVLLGELVPLFGELCIAQEIVNYGDPPLVFDFFEHSEGEAEVLHPSFADWVHEEGGVDQVVEFLDGLQIREYRVYLAVVGVGDGAEGRHVLVQVPDYLGQGVGDAVGDDQGQAADDEDRPHAEHEENAGLDYGSDQHLSDEPSPRHEYL